MQLRQVTISLSDGSSFDIWMSHPEFAEAAAMNWEVRTKEYTDRSFCDYINGKRLDGKSDHYALTNEDLVKIHKPSKSNG